MKPIVLKIKTLSASERRITAEIIDCIREIDLLKIHLEMGYPSLMEFLVRECGYSETAALRRIDAARIVNSIPEIRADLKSGSLNLSQVSIVAQSVRQKEKLGEKVSLSKKIELVNAVKHKRSFEVQKIAAQILDLPIVQTEKTRAQADESVRIEMSLSKSEMEILQKAKELLGHIRPGMSIKELVVLMAERLIKARDPIREKQDAKNSGSASESKLDNSSITQSKPVKRVSTALRRHVFLRDQVCQWIDPISRRKCGSRHLLEIDHRTPKWAGGGHEPENLELKCRAHNHLKYRMESGMRARL